MDTLYLLYLKLEVKIGLKMALKQEELLLSSFLRLTICDYDRVMNKKIILHQYLLFNHIFTSSSNINNFIVQCIINV